MLLALGPLRQVREHRLAYANEALKLGGAGVGVHLAKSKARGEHVEH